MIVFVTTMLLSTVTVVTSSQIEVNVPLLGHEELPFGEKLSFVGLLKETTHNTSTNITLSSEHQPGENLDKSRVDVDVQCRVYLADSTIPNAGWGIFAGVDITEGDEFAAPGDAIISFHAARGDLLGEYAWGDDKSFMVGFGMGALPNCLYPLINVHFEEAHHVDCNYRAVHNFTANEDPGFGATTVHYTESGGHAIDMIQAGSEIFIDYGEGYFVDENRIKNKFGYVPFNEHFEQADDLLHQFRKVCNAVVDAHPSQIERASKEVEVNNFSLDLYQITKSVLSLWHSRTYSALPSEVNNVNSVLDTLGSTSRINANRSIRSIDELKKHGTCMDHLKFGDSTIPFAGKGAFANKFLPKGTIVAPLPLIQTPRSSLFIYNYDDGTDANQRIVHHELYLNYCFGHHESTILLCPYGIGSSLVNHPGKDQQANVRLQWSTKHTKEAQWLNMPLHEWKDQLHTGLALEYIAIRDIQEGEEIFLDYGIKWQNAWDAHVQNYITMFSAFNGADDGFVYEDVTVIHPWTFRHEIQIPDDVMPVLWKDLKA